MLWATWTELLKMEWFHVMAGNLQDDKCYNSCNIGYNWKAAPGTNGVRVMLPGVEVTDYVL